MSSDQINHEEPSSQKVLISALGWLGVFLVFVVIVWITYGKTPSIDGEEVAATERFEIKARVQASQQNLVSSYSWVNQPDGIVRIPVERAKEITIGELTYSADGK